MLICFSIIIFFDVCFHADKVRINTTRNGRTIIENLLSMPAVTDGIHYHGHSIDSDVHRYDHYRSDGARPLQNHSIRFSAAIRRQNCAGFQFVHDNINIGHYDRWRS